MKIIAGIAGKSRVLERIMKDLKAEGEEMLVIDRVCLPHIQSIGKYAVNVGRDESLEDIFNMLFRKPESDVLNEIDVVILEVNGGVYDIAKFVEFEKRIGKPVIATIQQDFKDVKVYEIS